MRDYLSKRNFNVDDIIYRSIIRINGIELFYRDTRLGDSVIICLHGCWGRGETWTELISRYQNEYRIIAPDQRGHGLSGKPSTGYSAEDFVSDAYGLLSVLGCVQVIVIGHSMGGRIAGHLAAMYPEFIKAAVIIDENAEDVGSAIAAQTADPENDGLTYQWPETYATYDEAIKELKMRFPCDTNVRYFLDSLTETPEGYRFMFSRSAMASIGRSYRPWYDILSRIRCPVLLIRAADSWCLPESVAVKMRSLITNCTFAEIKHSDHMVYTDNPNEFYEVLDQFLHKL